MIEKKVSPTKEEFKRMKEDLEDLGSYTEEFFSFLPLAVCTLSGIGVIINVNKSFETLTEYKATEIVGEPFEIIFVQKKKAEQLLKETEDKRKIEFKEFLIQTKEKKKIPVNIFTSVREDKKGKTIGYFASIIDISELKKFQKELEVKVEERTEELQEKVEELENFQRIAIGRELKMVELKEEMEKLEKELKEIKGR